VATRNRTSNVRSCVIYIGPSSTMAGFIRVLLFPMEILIPQTAPQSLIVLSSTNYGLVVFDVDADSEY
jgi:hypothetical protein